MIQARRALTALAIVVALGGFSYAILSTRGAAKHEHMIKCLSAYMAFLQVVGPEAEGIERLKSCEHSPNGMSTRQMARSPSSLGRRSRHHAQLIARR
jgi:hypothetical protein